MSGVRWADIRKADGMHRSRLLAKGIKTDTAPELSAAIPPIESLKFLPRRAGRASAQVRADASGARPFQWHRSPITLLPREVGRVLACPSPGRDFGEESGSLRRTTRRRRQESTPRSRGYRILYSAANMSSEKSARMVIPSTSLRSQYCGMHSLNIYID